VPGSFILLPLFESPMGSSDARRGSYGVPSDWLEESKGERLIIDTESTFLIARDIQSINLCLAKLTFPEVSARIRTKSHRLRGSNFSICFGHRHAIIATITPIMAATAEGTPTASPIISSVSSPDEVAWN
jgi:hypothetical protein